TLAADLVRDPHSVDDLAQEAWLQALRRPPRHGTSLRSWLAALVASLCSNRNRGDRRRQAREASVQPPAEVDAAADLVEREQVRQRLLAAVLRLEERFRTAVLLRYYEELSPKQIAARLGVPAATVRTRVSRGLERLRAELDREHGDLRTAWALPLFALPGVHASASLPLLAVLAMKKVPILVAALLVLVAALTLTVFMLTAPPPAAPEAHRGEPPATVTADDTPTTAPETAAAVHPASHREAVGAAPPGPSATEAEATGELFVMVQWADKTQAPGVHLHIAARVRGASRPVAQVVSDARGHAVVRVPLGKVEIRTDRGGEPVEAEVIADQRSEALVALAAGVDVTGIVHDANGAAIAGAQIWLTSFQSPWCAMALVAQSDAQGAFVVRAAPKQQSLGATAAGFAPSPLVDLELCDTKVQPVPIELVLREPGGALAGRIVDEKGNGVAGATIAVGDPNQLIDHRVDGRMAEKWAPARAVTDENGAYRLEGLLPATHPVEVWAPTFAFWHGECTIAAQETARLDVTLPQPVTVHGIVTGEDEAPLAGAIVRAFPHSFDESFLMGGQYDYESTFGYPFAIADAAGRYRVQRVAPGELQLYASLPPSGRREVLPWAHEVATAAPGESFEWNPKVEPGPTIQGVVRYRDGAPMPNSFISVTVPGDKQRQSSVVTDAQGRFRFVHLKKQAYDVSVQVWTPPKGAPPVEARNVWPDSGELELTAAYDAPVKVVDGSVRGAVVDAAGRCANPAAMRVSLANDNRSWNTARELDGGKFSFDGVEPGKKRVTVLAGEDPIYVGPEFELHAAEQKELGVITTEPGGRLTLQIVRGAGTEALEPVLYLRPEGAMHARKVSLGTATKLTVDNLCLGEHRISSWQTGMAHIESACRVVAGEDTAVKIELRAAVSREFVVEYGPEQRVTRIRIEDERGGEVWDFAPERLVDRPYHSKVQVPLGKFVCRVETAGGGKAEVAFEMSSLDAEQPPVVVEAK
ncbi:MAG: sigma-70 family RNA polymerase sigma factor, partial [Planctomycetota bacterium]